MALVRDRYGIPQRATSGEFGNDASPQIAGTGACLRGDAQETAGRIRRGRHRSLAPWLAPRLALSSAPWLALWSAPWLALWFAPWPAPPSAPAPTSATSHAAGRSDLFATTILRRPDVSVRSCSSSALQWFAAIEHEDQEVGHLSRVLAARHPFAFNDIERLAPAGGIDERDRQSFHVDLLGNQVASRPRDRGHDRAIRT